eukprot:PhF_6_TR7893/c1_g1_i2/m.11625
MTCMFDTCCVATSDESTVYCFGGADAMSELADFYVLHITNKTWVKITPTTAVIPPERRLNYCFLDEQRNEYITGMGYQTTLSSQNDIWSFNLSTYSWRADQTSVMSPSLPEMRDSLQWCTYHRPGSSPPSFYVWGGWGRVYWHNDHWEVAFNETSRKRYWKLLREDMVLPASRARASVVGFGRNIYVAFGRTGDGTNLGDLWSTDITTQKWVSLASPPSKTIAARYGASVVVYGFYLLYFGGASSVALNDVTAYNILSNSWAVMDVAPDSPLPSPRVYPGASMISEDEMAVYAGLTYDGSLIGDLWLYNIPKKTWTLVAPETPTSAPKPRGNHFFCRFENRELGIHYAAGGGWDANGGPLFDRWRLQIKRAETNGSPLAAWLNLPNEVNQPGTKNINFNRAEMGFGCSGSRVFMAGGSITTGNAAAVQNLVSTWDLAEGNVLHETMPAPVYLDTGVFLRNTFYVFGGHRIWGSLRRSDSATNIMQMYTFPPQKICPRNTTLDTDCVQCSQGSLYDSTTQSCVFCPAGTYQLSIYSACEQCPAGTFSKLEGATSSQVCQLCPEGTYQELPGQTTCKKCPEDKKCPIGAKDTNSEIVKATVIDFEERQPPEYVPGEVPFGVYIALIVYISVIVPTIFTILFLLRHFKRKRLAQYLSEDSQQKIQSVFEVVADKNGALQEEKLNLLFLHLQLPAFNAENISHLRARFDENSSGALSYEETLTLMSELVEGGMVTYGDLTATETYSDELLVSSLPKRRSLRDVDLFSDSHLDEEVGSPIRIKTKVSGGIVSIFYITIVIGFVLLLVNQYVFENETEDRTSLPKVAVGPELFSTNIRVLIRTNEGSSNSETCVLPGSNSKQCAPQTSVTMTGINVGANGKIQMQCVFDAPDVCAIVWLCTNCTLTDGAVMKISNTHRDMFASLLTVIVEVSAAIVKQTAFFNWENDGAGNQHVGDDILRIDQDDVDYSRVKASSRAPGQSVFRGQVPTVLNVKTTPTVFRQFSAAGALLEKHTGSHVERSGFTTGSSVGALDFYTNLGLNIRIVINVVETSSLFVTRRGKDSFITLISSILGAISGLSGVAVLMCDWLDKIQEAMDERKEKKATRRNVVVSPHKKPPPSSVEHLTPLVESGLPFAAAYEIHKRLSIHHQNDKNSQLHPPPASTTDKFERVAERGGMCSVSVPGSAGSKGLPFGDECVDWSEVIPEEVDVEEEIVSCSDVEMKKF